VKVEHAFGILKARWASLRSLRLMVKTRKDEARAYGFVQAGMILHNLLVSTWIDAMTPREVAKWVDYEKKMQRKRRADLEAEDTETEDEDLDAGEERQRALCNKMLEFELEDIDLDDCRW
jgi:hypothetical protein